MTDKDRLGGLRIRETREREACWRRCLQYEAVDDDDGGG